MFCNNWAWLIYASIAAYKLRSERQVC